MQLTRKVDTPVLDVQMALQWVLQLDQIALHWALL